MAQQNETQSLILELPQQRMRKFKKFSLPYAMFFGCLIIIVVRLAFDNIRPEVRDKLHA